MDRYGKGYFKRGVDNQWVGLGRLMAGRTSERVLRSTPVRPVYSTVMVTQNCNYKCEMCSFWHRNVENELTLKELQCIFADLRALGIAQVNLTGGEPFLRSDLAAIVAAANDQAFRMIQVTTNASLASRQRILEVLEAGLRRIAISVDGLGDHHDKQRGVPGAWGKCVATLDTLRELRATRYPSLEIELAMVLSRQNVGDLGGVLALCKDYQLVMHVQFLDNVQFFATDVDHDIDLTTEEVDDIIGELHTHVERSPSMDPLMTHQGLEYVRRYMKREELTGLPRPSCGVGYALLYIDSLGNVYPGCFAMAPVGNIRKQSLAEIVDSRLHRAVAQDMFNLNCPTCPQGLAWGVFTNPTALVREALSRAKDASLRLAR
jgi:MoaA/NifB/PqqE/SkfB family radical SAM enzyme